MDKSGPKLPRSRYTLPRFRRSRPVVPYPEEIVPADFVALDQPNDPDLSPDEPSARSPEDVADYTPTPSDFVPTPKPPPGPLAKFPNPAYALPVLLAWGFFFAASVYSWNSDNTAEVGARSTSGLWVSQDSLFVRGEWWRLVTALFTHANAEHLLANSPLFLIFGWYLRAFFGRLAFPIAAIGIGAASNLMTVLTYAPKERLLGASGMLYGMVALWLCLFVRFDTRHSYGTRAFRALAVAVLLLFPTTFHPTTSYTAHAFGFVIGLGVGIPLAHFVRLQD